MRLSSVWQAGVLVAMGVPLGYASPSLALQPLSEFVAAARTHSPDTREGAANLASQRAQSEVALARLGPNASLRLAYTRNQYDVAFSASQLLGSSGADLLKALGTSASAFPAVTLTPSNQLDATFNIGVPLLDVAGLWRLAAARLGEDSASYALQATHLQVEAQVIQDYYQVIADQALVTASERALEVALASAKSTHDRVQLGRSPVLEDDRAVGQVEQQRQALTQAQLLLSMAIQSLDSASGIRPELASAPAPIEDDLHEEPPLEQFEPGPEGTPAVVAARLATRAAEKGLRGAWLTLVPTLSGAFTEHDGNYAGFGHEATWTAGLVLQWYVDFQSYGGIHLEQAAVAASKAREDRAQLAVHDAVHNTWEAVHAAIARSRSARVQEKVTRHAEELAQDRYEAGSSTQLDLLQAQRDAFAAELTRIQSDADLINARAQLRLAAGRDPLADSRGTP